MFAAGGARSRWRWRLPAGWVIASAVATSAARAHDDGDDETPRPERHHRSFDRRPFDVEARFGFGTPVGLIGLVAEGTPLPWLTVGAGAGLNGFGDVWDGHVRVRPYIDDSHPRRLRAFTVELAVSRGRYSRFSFDPFASMCEGPEDDPTDPCYNPTTNTLGVFWAQGEIGWEVRSASGSTVRPSLGLARILGSPPWQCETRQGYGPCPYRFVPSWVPVLSIALGTSFGG